jgi:hypothetical protein
MIRELTKSTMSFSWALTLLGLKQAGNLFRPGQQRTGNLLMPMTQVTVDQLDNSLKGVYRTGENLQACAVDMAFAWMNPINWFNPNAWMRSFTGAGQRQGNNQGASQAQGCCGQSQGYSSNQDFSQSGIGGSGFTQATAGIGQAISQAASGFTQAIGQAASGLTQAVTNISRQAQNTGNAPQSGGASAPVSNDSAAAGWGPMPGDK